MYLVRTRRQWVALANAISLRAGYGGRVPGARSYPWRSMFQPDGADLRPRAAIAGELARLGHDGAAPVVPYCTRGVRSSFAAAVLTWAGFDVRNFVGAPPPAFVNFVPLLQLVLLPIMAYARQAAEA